MLRRILLLGLSMGASAVLAQPVPRLENGRVKTGATVSFIRSNGWYWSIESSGPPRPASGTRNPRDWRFAGRTRTDANSQRATRQFGSQPWGWTLAPGSRTAKALSSR